MRIIGISPLDKDTNVCLIEDGKVVAALGEERLSRVKMQDGFPYLALEELFKKYNLTADKIDTVAYAFFDAAKEATLMRKAHSQYNQMEGQNSTEELFEKFNNLPAAPSKKYNIPGLAEEQLHMKKPWYMETYYAMASKRNFFGQRAHKKRFNSWLETAEADHKKYEKALLTGLEKFKLGDKLKRVDHHLTHASNAYYTSGFDEALIVTLDGYGSGAGGSISVGKAGKIKRVHSLPYPGSLGEFYERVTSSLGFKPSRHEGKIVGLAAYDDPDFLYDIVRSYFHVKDGNVFYRLPHNIYFTRHLAAIYSKPAVAAAFQKVLEKVACEYVAYHLEKTGMKNLVLSGGVVANVKMNQRLFEMPGVEKIYIHPGMADGGCGVGAALWIASSKKTLQPYELKDVYFGPEYSEEEMEAELEKQGLKAERPENIEKSVARLLADGKIVARYNGRMEYGPRSLGNRSILYHAKDPSVNLWLNTQLQRTEFMPFAPATLYEERDKCYKNMNGAEYTSRFMTVTFDCKKFMLETCPAAVHVDGTARPQLVSEESNESFYKIIKEYHKITGIPSIINTSFNMHEEPIVCTPYDAIRAFKLGHLHYLALGPFLVKGEGEE
ncbi:probable carbamoyl transferase [hydrothermal vent metagenome]|uniref:Probable carbamoyl transferase n=1 Tax=hydrothermal vent metagenome TaxID=652676 RepID=A0A3B0ZI63_9ZZZZ